MNSSFLLRSLADGSAQYRVSANKIDEQGTRTNAPRVDSDMGSESIFSIPIPELLMSKPEKK